MHALVIQKIADLIRRAPAGGIFHDAEIGDVRPTVGGLSFALDIPAERSADGKAHRYFVLVTE